MTLPIIFTTVSFKIAFWSQKNHYFDPANKTTMTIDEQLKPFLSNLESSPIASSIKAVLLYGKHLRIKNYHESNCNLLFVFDQIKPETLEGLSQVFEKETNLDIQPFILTLDELQMSADVYPIKFLDISQNHKILIGSDPFDQVEVHQDNLRLRCEQELRNIALRLRYTCVKNEGDIRAIRVETRKSLYPLMNNLEVILMLKKEKVLTDYDQIIKEVKTELSIDLSTLEKLLHWSNTHEELTQEQFLSLFHSYRELLNNLIHIIDNH